MSTTAKKGELAILWITELLSGTYKQTTEELGDVNNGFCCLGVANYVCGLKEEDGGSLLHTHQDIGLISANGGARFAVNRPLLLTSLNDTAGRSLEEIGETLTEYPELYFEPAVAEYIKKHIEDELYD